MTESKLPPSDHSAVFADWMVFQPKSVRYQAVCSIVNHGSQAHFTYGLECLVNHQGTWIQLDVIHDVSADRDSVLHLAERFHRLQLSPLHFRDAVLDSVNA